VHVIIAYDISVERVNKVKAYLRTQLTWIQNSLFEGEISDSMYLRIKNSLLDIIEPEKDSITIYILPNKHALTREDLGVKKGHADDRVL